MVVPMMAPGREEGGRGEMLRTETEARMVGRQVGAKGIMDQADILQLPPYWAMSRVRLALVYGCQMQYS